MKYISRLIQKLRAGTLKEVWQEVKWILRYIIRYKRAVLYYTALGFLGTIMGLAGSVASKYLIDAVTGYDSMNIGFLIILMAGMSVGNIVIGGVNGRISARISLKVKNEIQAEVYDKIMDADWEAVAAFHSGDLLNRFSSDAGTVADSVLGWLPSLITRLLQFFGILAILLYYDPAMAVIALLSAPVMLLMSKTLMARMRDYNKKVRQFSSEMTAFQEESFQNIQLIKSFRLTEAFGEKLRSVQKRYTSFALNYNIFSIYTSSLLSFVGMGVGLATFGWGVYRLWSGAISYGTMTLFLQLSGGLSDSFSSLVDMVPSAIGAATSAGRIMEIEAFPCEKERSPACRKDSCEFEDKGVPGKQDLAVCLSQVSFAYRGHEVLNHASLCAMPRELTAIIGASGEGKTTLLHILLGLLHPSGGEVKLIDGKGSEAPVSAAGRRYFAYVSQGNSIFTGTIADNLRLVKPEATTEELVLALKAACAYDFINQLPDGIDTAIGENGNNFSEGQIQRICIARALLRDAPILLLDEATSALDPETEKLVVRGIMGYSLTHTCILTSHRPSIIAMCDRVYRIDHTQVSEVQPQIGRAKAGEIQQTRGA